MFAGRREARQTADSQAGRQAIKENQTQSKTRRHPHDIHNFPQSFEKFAKVDIKFDLSRKRENNKFVWQTTGGQSDRQAAGRQTQSDAMRHPHGIHIISVHLFADSQKLGVI